MRISSAVLLFLITVAGAIVGWLAGAAVHMAILAMELPAVQAASGTVERRIHLKMEGPYDTDRPRTFVCRESP